MVSPYLLHLLVFSAFPVVFSIILTFFNWNIISRMEWNGLGNWKHVISDRLFWKSIFNNLEISFGSYSSADHHCPGISGSPKPEDPAQKFLSGSIFYAGRNFWRSSDDHVAAIAGV